MWQALPEDFARAKHEGVVVVGHHAVDKALVVEPSALRLSLGGRHHVWQAEQLQQLLDLAVHHLCRAVCRACLQSDRCQPVVRWQPKRYEPCTAARRATAAPGPRRTSPQARQTARQLASDLRRDRQPDSRSGGLPRPSAVRSKLVCVHRPAKRLGSRAVSE